jgi:hypothetical protein
MAQAPTPSRKADLRWAIAAGVLFVLALLLYGAIQGQEPESLESQHTDAYFACQEFVGRQLKAPATADFPRHDSSDVSVEGENPFTVRSVVDSENGFGANVRSRFACSVTRTPDGNWRSDRVTLN